MAPSELMAFGMYISEAQKAGYEIVTVPENVRDKIAGQTDLHGAPIKDLSQFKQMWNESFEFQFISPSNLTPQERVVFDATPDILAVIGGKPRSVAEILISETMRVETYAFVEARGVWVSPNIIIKRTQLQRLEWYAATLLHWSDQHFLYQRE